MTDSHLDELALRAVDGDHAARDEFLRRARPMVLRFCQDRMGRTVGPVTADDVAQEVLIALCPALERWRPEKRVMAFVFTIAAHKTIDAFRVASRDRSVPTDAVPDAVDIGAGPEQLALEASHSGEVHRLLTVLPAHYREVLELRVGLGLTADEAARRLGSTPGAVRVLQHRAMAALRAHLGEARCNRSAA